MEGIWTYSRPVDAGAIERNTASFTTLPVRINERNDVADAATQRALRDWENSLGDGLAERALISFSDFGNLGAFAYPEAAPERLAILTYLTDIGMLHDDGYEALEMTAATDEHRDFGLLFDPHKTAQLRPGTRAPRLKKLVSRILLEAVEVDREMGMYMFDMYNKGWLAVAGKEAVTQFTSLDAYQAYRKDDFGLSAFWAMTEFAMEIRLSDEDRKLVETVMEPIDKAVVWTNDYWSFERESWEARVNGSRINNFIEVIRQTRNMSADEAKAEGRRLLIGLEQEYTIRKKAFLAQHAPVPPHLKKWVEVVGVIVAGTHYWASRAERHRALEGRAAKHRTGPGIVDLSHANSGSSLNDGARDSFGSDSQSSRPSHSSDSPLTDYYSSSGTDGQEDENLNQVTDMRNKKPITQSDSMKDGIAMLHDAVVHCETRIKELEAENSILLEPHREQGIRIPAKATWYKPSDAALQAPIEYICSMPSKGVRSRMLEAFDYWFKADELVLNNISYLVDLLHNASLILDDIEDGSPKRRGKPSTHVIFGHSQAINSANFMFVGAVKFAQNFRSPNAISILLEELQNMYLGQSWDLYWMYNLSCPSPDEYLNMVDNKTGALFRLLVRLMQAETRQESVPTDALDQLTILFGRFFQVRDDYMNLCSDAYAQQKGAYEDLDEGKFSYPIVYCMERQERFRNIIKGVFRQQRSSIANGVVPLPLEVKEYVMENLHMSGTFEHCRQYLMQLEADIVAEIGRVEEATNEANPVLRLLLKKLSVQYQ
ncbi:hypothetical protein N8T08_006661 [Aspergillus melleus]|uniref:Uncharacterized protein n=1 Tax=Aspergillus melleus TaxID=138277 RepID=A0ACC3BF70_9EURO|nr:hypothetical protein N8T08_006661 [Aspergillus melleus]